MGCTYPRMYTALVKIYTIYLLPSAVGPIDSSSRQGFRARQQGPETC